MEKVRVIQIYLAVNPQDYKASNPQDYGDAYAKALRRCITAAILQDGIENERVFECGEPIRGARPLRELPYGDVPAAVEPTQGTEKVDSAEFSP